MADSSESSGRSAEAREQQLQRIIAQGAQRELSRLTTLVVQDLYARHMTGEFTIQTQQLAPNVAKNNVSPGPLLYERARATGRTIQDLYHETLFLHLYRAQSADN